MTSQVKDNLTGFNEGEYRRQVTERDPETSTYTPRKVSVDTTLA